MLGHVRIYIYIYICVFFGVSVCTPCLQDRQARSVAISRQQTQIEEFQKWWASGQGDAAVASHPLLSLAVSREAGTVLCTEPVTQNVAVSKCG